MKNNNKLVRPALLQEDIQVSENLENLENLENKLTQRMYIQLKICVMISKPESVGYRVHWIACFRYTFAFYIIQIFT